MASGVLITDECKTAYATDMKLGKHHKYIIYRLADDMKEIIIDKRSEKVATYEDFVQDLAEAESKKECRYAVFDMSYLSGAGTAQQKLVFISWAPDTAKVKNKMVHASSKDAFKKALGDGLSKEIQASDSSDLEQEEVIKQLRQLDRH